MLPIRFPTISQRRKIREGSVTSRQNERSSTIDRFRNVDESSIDSNSSSAGSHFNGDPNRSELSVHSYQTVALDLSSNCNTLSVSDKFFNLNMDPNTIAEALRPVPEFDGNSNMLTRSIRICDQIVLAYVKNEPEQELNNLCLINGILNKITGAAG